MSLSKRISQITKSLKERDIIFFRKDLQSFKDLISKMQEANPNASILDCIEGYNNSLKKLILKTNNIMASNVYSYIAIEALLNSRDYNTIVSRINKEQNYKSGDIKFTGNLQEDFIGLVRSFFHSDYELRYIKLQEYLQKYPNDKKLKAELRELEDKNDKIENGKLTVYDINKIMSREKSFFLELKKILKLELSKTFATNIILKIEFLRQIGALKNYENEYNHTLDKLFMPSSFRIKDRQSFEKELLNIDKLKNYPLEELIALNAFWTNRLAKEVERRNEVIYVLQNTYTYAAFSEGKDINLIDEDIMYYLAEYRAIVPYITNYKVRKKDTDEVITIDDDSNLLGVVFDINKIFDEADIDYYGFDDLDAMAYNVLLLNNRSQLLYDQKDMEIQEMISLIVNTNAYRNAGIWLDNDNTKRPLIAIDLKGFNAPLMLHMIKGDLTKCVKRVSKAAKFPVYRGKKNFEIVSSENGNNVAKTNILFKLNPEQRKDIAARAGVVGARDTNGRYVTHISWMLNPKKDMPKLISEPRRIIDLETGEIEELKEYRERKK